VRCWEFEGDEAKHVVSINREHLMKLQMSFYKQKVSKT